VRDRIVRPGYLASEEVGGLIAGCAAFAYVSLYEGYGMPVLDAMAFGAPVVTSRTTSMPEAAGGAAVLVDPASPADIARGLREAVARQADLRGGSVAGAAARDWDDVAREHLAVYRFAAARDGR
jgi:glycosyltransferase involved in cell wall biosynthesis